jgi:hybrid cluster-associated redox disulfide protein
MKIGPDTVIADLLREHPEVKKVLAGYEMRCPGCRGSAAETLRSAAQNHGVELSRLLDELRAAARPGS